MVDPCSVTSTDTTNTVPLFDWTVSSTGDLRGLRRHFDLHMRERLGMSDDHADDLQLIASELVTNALEHANSRIVHVRCGRTEHGVVLDIAYDDASAPPAPGPLPDSSVIDGRGLAIAQALTTTLDLSWSGGVSTVCATLDCPLPVLTA